MDFIKSLRISVEGFNERIQKIIEKEKERNPLTISNLNVSSDGFCWSEYFGKKK